MTSFVGWGLNIFSIVDRIYGCCFRDVNRQIAEILIFFSKNCIEDVKESQIMRNFACNKLAACL